MKSRFEKVVRRVADWVEHRPSGQRPGNTTDEEVPERFVMKPGEVQIIEGGGAPVTRLPGQRRGE